MKYIVTIETIDTWKKEDIERFLSNAVNTVNSTHHRGFGFTPPIKEYSVTTALGRSPVSEVSLTQE